MLRFSAVMSLLVLFGSCNGSEYCSTPPDASCSGMSEGGCVNRPGCSWDNACVSKECMELTDSAVCASAPYCTWMGSETGDSGSCSATGDREGFSYCGGEDAAICETTSFCAFRPACVGEVEPCEGRSSRICNASPFSYCEWVKETGQFQLY